MYKLFDELFDELSDILDTHEFACHKINNGKLCPVYKNDTNEIGLNAWKNFHAQNPVYIKNDEILKKVINTKQSISINNLDEDGRNYSCFKNFNIKAICIIPIIKDDMVVSIIVIPVLKQYYYFTQEKKKKCNDIVKKYNDTIIKMIL